MKRQGLLVLAVSSLCGMLTGSLGAQSIVDRLQVKIPFEFGVQGTTLPAGNYNVRLNEGSGLVQIQSAGGSESAFTVTYNSGAKAGSDHAELTFHRYGSRYFLAQVSAGGGCPVRGFSKSPAEREAAETASSHPVQGVTIVALLDRR